MRHPAGSSERPVRQYSILMPPRSLKELLKHAEELAALSKRLITESERLQRACDKLPDERERPKKKNRDSSGGVR